MLELTSHPNASLYFSGHAHVRDCLRFDDRSQVLASGRYLETLGFTSLKLPSSPSTVDENLHITRQYLDTNLATYHCHSHTSTANFSTPKGKKVQHLLDTYERSFNLSYTYGVAPHSFYLNRYPPDHKMSLINLYATQVFQTVLAPPPTSSSLGARETEREPVFLFNTGAARFDIFKGNFTRDDQLAVIPFENGLWSIENLDSALVKRVEKWLNSLPGEPEFAESSSSGGSTEMRLQAMAEKAYASEGQYELAGTAFDTAKNLAILRDSLAFSANRRRAAQQYDFHLSSTSQVLEQDKAEKEQKLSYGYVTYDSCPGTPDDTPHRPLPAFDIPDFVLSRHAAIPPSPPPSSSSSSASVESKREEEEKKLKVDLVFYEFIAPLVLKALNALQKEKKFGMKDVEVYSELKANELLGEYAKIAWN